MNNKRERGPHFPISSPSRTVERAPLQEWLRRYGGVGYGSSGYGCYRVWKYTLRLVLGTVADRLGRLVTAVLSIDIGFLYGHFIWSR